MLQGTLKGCLLYWCIQVDKCSVSLVFISPQTSHSTFGTSCLCLIRSTSIFAVSSGEILSLVANEMWMDGH